MTPEGKIKAKVSKLLKSYGEKVYYVMPVVSGMGQPQLDYVGCANGRYFTIETKAPGGKPTDRQKALAERVLLSNGQVMLVRDDADVEKLKVLIDTLLSLPEEWDNI